jgi:WD40 repeat protein
MSKIILILLLPFLLFARDIKPTFVLKSKGFVNDFVIDGIYLYVAHDEGSVEVFDLSSRKLVGEIFIKPTYDQLGQKIVSKVLSVDRFKNKTLMVTTTFSGYRNIWIHDGKELKQIINTDKKMTIKEANFIDSENMVFGTLGYDLIKYTLKDNYTTYKKHPEQSFFSDMQMSSDKKSFASSSESGKVTITDTKSGKLIKEYDSLNVDNVYKVAYRNGHIITAGKDRRVGVYPKDEKPYYIRSDFLVYCVGISLDGKTGIYSSGEDNNLQLFDIKSGNKTHKLIGHDAVPSTIKFFDENGLFSAGYENNIYYWHID